MLTKKQKKVLDFVKGFIEKNGYAPSLKEVQKKFKLASVSTAHYYMQKLEEEGYITREENRARSVEVSAVDEVGGKFFRSKRISSAIMIPVYGVASAGPATVFAEQNKEGYLKINKGDFDNVEVESLFAVRAEGDSMNRAKIKGNSIENGDFVVIDGNYRQPEDGDYVLSIIDNCANLKRYRIDPETGQRELVSESTENYKPIFLYEGDDYMVNGKIIGVIRSVRR